MKTLLIALMLPTTLREFGTRLTFIGITLVVAKLTARAPRSDDSIRVLMLGAGLGTVEGGAGNERRLRSRVGYERRCRRQAWSQSPKGEAASARRDPNQPYT